MVKSVALLGRGVGLEWREARRPRPLTPLVGSVDDALMRRAAYVGARTSAFGTNGIIGTDCVATPWRPRAGAARRKHSGLGVALRQPAPLRPGVA
jgi:hypothetical protein